MVRDRNGNIETSVKFDTDKPLSKFRIGSYTASLLAVYDNGKRDVPLEAHLSFWVFPWKIIVGVLIIIIAPVLLYHLVSRKRKR